MSQLLLINGVHLSDRVYVTPKNSIYAIADYMEQLVGILLSVSFSLGRLGLSQYGIWTLTSAAVSRASMISRRGGKASIEHSLVAQGLHANLPVFCSCQLAASPKIQASIEVTLC
jgi:hypothetical protein